MNIPAMATQNSVLPQMEQNRLTGLMAQANLDKNNTNEELMSLSRQFESIFIHQLLKSMRATIQKSGLFESHATRMYESMHDQELASLMSEKRSIGLADIIYKDLLRMEEKRDQSASESNTSIQHSNQSIDSLG
mgnify:FL=1